MKKTAHFIKLLYFFAFIGVIAIIAAIIFFFNKGDVIVPLGGGVAARQEIFSPSYDSKVMALESGSAGILEESAVDRKIIKTGSLSLLVFKIENSVDSIKALADGLGGFVVNSRVYEVADGLKSGFITIKVPADKLDETMAEIKKMAVKVEDESVSVSDVTEQYIDLDARIRNMKAEEEQYLEILKRAKTVEDTLNVTSKLSEVRSRIESTERQLKYLSQEVEMSSITVSLTSEADVEIFGVRWRPIFTIKQAFRNLLEGLTGFVDSIISFVFYLPVLLLWVAGIGALFFGTWKIFLWVKSKKLF